METEKEKKNPLIRKNFFLNSKKCWVISTQIWVKYYGQKKNAIKNVKLKLG